MPTMHVYHRNEMPDPLQTESDLAEEWPHFYHHVADVEAESIEDAYRLTNTIDRAWWNHQEVTPIAKTPMRSTSVGDVIVAPDGPKLCCPVGWQEVWTLRNRDPVAHERDAIIVVELKGGRIRNAIVNRDVEPTLICVDRDTDGIQAEFLSNVAGEDAAVRRIQVNPARDFTHLFKDALQALKGCSQ